MNITPEQIGKIAVNIHHASARAISNGTSRGMEGYSLTIGQAEEIIRSVLSESQPPAEVRPVDENLKLELKIKTDALETIVRDFDELNGGECSNHCGTCVRCIAYDALHPHEDTVTCHHCGNWVSACKCECEVERYKDALNKINTIRNSIVGLQCANFSEHVYPLVAALNEAGMVGMDYPEALENFGTMLERTNKAEAALELARKKNGELRKKVKQLDESETELIKAVSFFACCIKSGEKWTDVCQKTYDNAIADQLEDDAKGKGV